MVKNVCLPLGVCLFGGLIMATNAFAADKQARDKVVGMAKTRDAVLEARPPLRLIDKAVRDDCAAKGKG